ncbi:MAG: sugar ABC transporter substrate-binding protein [Anaerolineae bacterium]|nr:sugar ABC transporter substrate-binding protein [Anaerolineae bacterium]
MFKKVIGLFFILALALAACGPVATPVVEEPATSEPTESPAEATEAPATELSPDIEAKLVIYDYGDTNDEAIRREAIARFNEKYPNVEVELKFNTITTWAEYLQQLGTQVAGGDAPDIVHLATEGVKMAVDNELAIPLDEYIASSPDGQALLDDVAPAMIDSLSADGKLYFLPAAWNNMMIHYNTKVFEEAGIERPSDDWTWDDFIAIAQQLTKDTDGDGKTDKWGFAMPYYFFGVTPWLYSNGTAAMNPELTESNLSDLAVIETVQFLQDIVYEYKVAPDPFNTDPNASSTLFASGDFAMAGGGHWPIQFYMANDFSDYDVLPWPQNKEKATVFGADGYGIYPGSENKELAFALMLELVSEETLAETVSAGVAIPARRSVAESPGFLAEPKNAQLFYGSLDYAKPVTAPPEYAEMSTIFMRWLDKVMADEMSAEDAMKGADEELKALLAK